MLHNIKFVRGTTIYNGHPWEASPIILLRGMQRGAQGAMHGPSQGKNYPKPGIKLAQARGKTGPIKPGEKLTQGQARAQARGKLVQTGVR